jgi:hypothetical protein
MGEDPVDRGCSHVMVEHGDSRQQADVADTVDQKDAQRASHRIAALLKKSNQEHRGQTDQLPTSDHQIE